MFDVLEKIVARVAAGQPGCVATLLKCEGSTPQIVGAKALISENALLAGTIGGGALEAEAMRRAREVIAGGRAVAFDFDLLGADATGSDPICGGRVRVLLEPLSRQNAQPFGDAHAALLRRQRGILATTFHPANDRVELRWLPPGTPFELASSDQLLDQLLAEQRSVCLTAALPSGEAVEVLLEPLLPRPLLLIAGGGHVGQAVARQADLVGFDVLVIDDRPEFTRAELFPASVKSHCDDVPRTLAEHPLGDDTYLVLVTRGHRHDSAALATCIHRRAAYLGMIGSRRKVALVREEFLASGRCTAEQFDRVCAPIGFDIGAVSVPEIAVSIVAQMIAVRRGKQPAFAGGSLPATGAV